MFSHVKHCCSWVGIVVVNAIGVAECDGDVAARVPDGSDAVAEVTEEMPEPGEAVAGLVERRIQGDHPGFDYTRLEQGVSDSASGAVIDALAAALRLDPAEHEHLRILAAPSPSFPQKQAEALDT
jgi:hypothetical protein